MYNRTVTTALSHHKTDLFNSDLELEGLPVWASHQRTRSFCRASTNDWMFCLLICYLQQCLWDCRHGKQQPLNTTFVYHLIQIQTQTRALKASWHFWNFAIIQLSTSFIISWHFNDWQFIHFFTRPKSSVRRFRGPNVSLFSASAFLLITLNGNYF